MIVSRNLPWRHILFYTWKSLLYFLTLSVIVYVLHAWFGFVDLALPFNAVATLSTALAIYLGFKNNSAYDRWWEARKIWGLLVNYSRAWGREVLTLPSDGSTKPVEYVDDCQLWQRRMIYRHIAFVHALRVYLRQPNSYNRNRPELIERPNSYDDIRKFIAPEEYEEVMSKKNPPNYLNQLQGEDLKLGYQQGWISDYRFVRLDETLNEFSNHQGKSERIKNTPFPRAYSFFSRVFVYIHGTLVPFAFIEALGWLNIPLSLLINFFFLALDLVGERVEDPFENRMDDTPLLAISLTIEENLKEMMGDANLPEKPEPVQGVVF